MSFTGPLRHQLCATRTLLVRRLAQPSLTSRTSRLLPVTSEISRISKQSTICTTTAKMSSGFSNADTGSKNPDPYVSKNKEEPALKDKVAGLVEFIERCKFCMMATHVKKDDLIVSRCMALAGKVRGLRLPQLV